MAFCPALFCPPSVRSLSDASEELAWRSGYACDWWGPSGIDSVHASNGGEKKPTYFIAINWPQLQYSGQCFSIWPASSYQEAAEIRKSPSQIRRMVKARAQLLLFGPVGGRLYCSPVPTALASFPNYPCKQWCLPERPHDLWPRLAQSSIAQHFGDTACKEKSIKWLGNSGASGSSTLFNRLTFNYLSP